MDLEMVGNFDVEIEVHNQLIITQSTPDYLG